MSNFTSLLFYLCAFVGSTLLMYYGDKRSNKIIIGMSLAIPVLIAGLRYAVGTDYLSYVSTYDTIANLPIGYLFGGQTSVEPGFLVLVKLSQLITGNPVFLFTASSTLTILFFYLGLKRYRVRHPALVYILFLLVIFPMTLNIVRQGIAISICFYAISFMIDYKPKSYFLWIIIASLFHMTALFLLPMYLLGRIVKKQKNNLFVLFLLKLTTLASLTILTLPYIFNWIVSMPLFEKYSMYQTFIGEGNNYILYLQFIILLLIVLLSRWALAKDSANIFLYFLVFAVLEILLNTLGFTSAFIKRISLYFSFYSLILVTGFVDIFNDRLGRFMVYSLVILYGVSYFYLAYYSLGQADLFPYQTIIGRGL